MANYLSRLTADMKTAMKAGDKPRLEVIRMLISELKRKAIDAQVDDLPDDEEAAVLQKAVKTRQDTVAQANAAGRTEVAAKVREVAAEIGFTGGKDMGRFMKEWMSRYKGLADGKLVQEALKSLG